MNGLILFLTWKLLSTSPTLCFKEIRVSTKIRVLSPGTLSEILDLRKFCQRLLPNPNALVAISKGMWAVKLCTNKILFGS